MKKLVLSLVFSVIFNLTVPFAVWAEEQPMGTVKASILVEASTGEVLSEENADEQLPIASVTKIMTMLIIMEKIDNGEMTLDDMVTASENAQSYGGSTMFLEAGEQLSVSDMLKGIAVASANDGCVAMAEHIAGSEDAFVEMMNKRAEELGMENTHFMNTNGLDEEGHYSSARDVAKMSRELILHKTIFNYTKIWMDSLRDGKFQLANTNKLIRYYPGATGLKTGSTDEAGCCLSATAERDGMELIDVVLGAENTKTRFAAASNLINMGYSAYSVKRYISKGEPMGKTKVFKGLSNEVSAEAAEDFSKLSKKSEPLSVEKEVKMKKRVTAPVHIGDKVGEAVFTVDGKVVRKVDIVASEEIEKKGFCRMLRDLIKQFIG